jgi:hypothetical protein
MGDDGFPVVPFLMDWLRCFKDYRKEFRAHAIQRLVERDITFEEFDEAVGSLDVISEYADDRPYPSCLALGMTRAKRPLHVVFSVNDPARTVYVITVYEPQASRWDEGFTRRDK